VHGPMNWTFTEKGGGNEISDRDESNFGQAEGEVSTENLHARGKRDSCHRRLREGITDLFIALHLQQGQIMKVKRQIQGGTTSQKECNRNRLLEGGARHSSSTAVLRASATRDEERPSQSQEELSINENAEGDY